MRLDKETVLVVDDEPLLRDIFAEWLAAEGYKVLTAENGVAALRVVSGHHVDVIVTDVRMPVMDGMTLLKRLHASEKEHRNYLPKVIFISGFSDVTERDAYDLGVEAMLHKPIDRDHFIRPIRRSLQSREKTWGQPPTETAEPIAMILPCVSDAIRDGLIEFGQGGFCLRVRNQSIGRASFELVFQGEPFVFAGHGVIRWVETGGGLAGIEIVNLDQECLQWAIELITSHAGSSYIPRACWGGARRPKAIT